MLAVTTTTSILLAPRGWSVRVEPIEGGLNVDPIGVPLASGRTAVLGALALSAAVGLLLAAIGTRRVRRTAPHAQAQPHRTTMPLSVGARTALTCGVGVAGVVAGHEITGATKLWLSAVLGPPSVLLLPLTTALLAHARRARVPPGDPEPAAVDLWRMASHGRPPAVDAPVLAPRPVHGPVPPGVVVPYPARLDLPLPPPPPPG